MEENFVSKMPLTLLAAAVEEGIVVAGGGTALVKVIPYYVADLKSDGETKRQDAIFVLRALGRTSS